MYSDRFFFFSTVKNHVSRLAIVNISVERDCDYATTVNREMFSLESAGHKHFHTAHFINTLKFKSIVLRMKLNSFYYLMCYVINHYKLSTIDN